MEDETLKAEGGTKELRDHEAEAKRLLEAIAEGKFQGRNVDKLVAKHDAVSREMVLLRARYIKKKEMENER